MSERIRGSYDDALYKSTYTLLLLYIAIGAYIVNITSHKSVNRVQYIVAQSSYHISMRIEKRTGKNWQRWPTLAEQRRRRGCFAETVDGFARVLTLIFLTQVVDGQSCHTWVLVVRRFIPVQHNVTSPVMSQGMQAWLARRWVHGPSSQ